MASAFYLVCILLTFVNAQQYNVLFVVVDDLRTELGGAYGQNDLLYTPNFESFMQSAFTFTHAYTQIAVCAATRASFLTGRRPDTTRVWNIGPYFRNTMYNNTGFQIKTLPQYFKEHANYFTIGSGKIFHPGSASGGHGACNPGNDEPYSWSETYWQCGGGVNCRVSSPASSNCLNGTGCIQSQSCIECLTNAQCYCTNTSNDEYKCSSAYSHPSCNDECFIDYIVASHTLESFKKVTTDSAYKNKPFFIAAGLKRPHLGFYAPERIYNLYPNSSIANAIHNRPPYNMPVKAFNNCSEIKNYPDVAANINLTQYKWENKTYDISLINDDYQHALRSAYYSSVTFMDEQFGRIIEGLFEYNLWNNTIVIVTGDHGWHLGEQGCFSKFTCFEVGVRIPLIVRIPGVNEGKYSDVLVEQLDMFPTLIDATNIGFTSNITKQLEGKSLLDVIKNPLDPPYFPQYAYSQYPRGGKAPNFTVMGISVRTTQWRYTEWLGWNIGNNVTNGVYPYPKWNDVYGIELYNHSNVTTDENDLNGYDNYNFAYDNDKQDIVKQMHQVLYSTWDNQSWTLL